MNFLLKFAQVHGIFVLAVLTASLWYFFLFNNKMWRVLKLIYFPVSHISSIANIYKNPSAFPITICYVISITGVFQAIFSTSPYVYLFSWGLILAVELYGVIAYLFRINKMRSYVASIVPVLIIISYGMVRTIQARDYQFMNNIDFVVSLLIFIGSVNVIGQIILKDRFVEELIPFFIFFGLIIYSFLHGLSSVAISIDILANLDFAYYSTITTLLFWTGSVPWIRYLKYRLC